MEFTEKARIMDSARINRALARLASEVLEENHGAGDLYLLHASAHWHYFSFFSFARSASLESFKCCRSPLSSWHAISISSSA